jgi:hypothetical protein
MEYGFSTFNVSSDTSIYVSPSNDNKLASIYANGESQSVRWLVNPSPSNGPAFAINVSDEGKYVGTAGKSVRALARRLGGNYVYLPIGDEIHKINDASPTGPLGAPGSGLTAGGGWPFVGIGEVSSNLSSFAGNRLSWGTEAGYCYLYQTDPAGVVGESLVAGYPYLVREPVVRVQGLVGTGGQTNQMIFITRSGVLYSFPVP